MSAPTTGNDYRPCAPADNGTRCATHGGTYSPQIRRCQTWDVLADIRSTLR